MPRLAKSLVLFAAAAHLAVAPLAYSTQSFALTGDVQLPAPYVSRAFDAVLVPIDDAVRTAFSLDDAATGVLVLAVEPGGVADSQGIEPGDVLSEIRGHKVTTPIEVDEIAYYWINQGQFDFGFDYYRAGVLATASVLITRELYEAAIDITTVSSWESWSVETSFSYEEFYEEYSVEMTETYESSETLIEETATSEEFSEEVTTEDSMDDSGDATDDSDGDGVSDAEDTDDDGDGVDDAEDTDDDGDGADDSAEDDGGDDSGDDSGDDGADEGGDE